MQREPIVLLNNDRHQFLDIVNHQMMYGGKDNDAEKQNILKNVVNSLDYILNRKFDKNRIDENLIKGAQARNAYINYLYAEYQKSLAMSKQGRR